MFGSSHLPHLTRIVPRRYSLLFVDHVFPVSPAVVQLFTSMDDTVRTEAVAATFSSTHTVLVRFNSRPSQKDPSPILDRCTSSGDRHYLDVDL